MVPADIAADPALRERFLIDIALKDGATRTPAEVKVARDVLASEEWGERVVAWLWPDRTYNPSFDPFAPDGLLRVPVAAASCSGASSWGLRPLHNVRATVQTTPSSRTSGGPPGSACSSTKGFDRAITIRSSSGLCLARSRSSSGTGRGCYVIRLASDGGSTTPGSRARSPSTSGSSPQNDSRSSSSIPRTPVGCHKEPTCLYHLARRSNTSRRQRAAAIGRSTKCSPVTYEAPRPT